MSFLTLRPDVPRSQRSYAARAGRPPPRPIRPPPPAVAPVAPGVPLLGAGPRRERMACPKECVGEHAGTGGGTLHTFDEFKPPVGVAIRHHGRPGKILW